MRIHSRLIGDEPNALAVQPLEAPLFEHINAHQNGGRMTLSRSTRTKTWQPKGGYEKRQQGDEQQPGGTRTETKHGRRRSIVPPEAACYIQLRDAGFDNEGPRRKLCVNAGFSRWRSF